MLLLGASRASYMLHHLPTVISQNTFRVKSTWQVLTYVVMTAVMVASKAAGEKGHPCLALKRPLTKLGGPLTNERGEWGGQESREPASLGPRTLLFVPPPFGMLLRSDRHHLKNNLMHGCSPPHPLFLYCSCVVLFVSLGLYHPWLCGEEWGMEDGKEAEGSQGGLGRKEAEPETGMLSWSSNTLYTNGTGQQDM